MLESDFGWTGVLAEPSPRWHYDLRKNRPNSTIITDCVYSVTGEILDFFVSDYGELSTLNEFRQSDASCASSGNAELRNSSGYNHEVLSISLNDIFIKYFNSLPIDYMSIDTEGSELEILKNFNFPKFAPKLVTVEHNGTDAESKLDALFLANDYKRVFSEYTAFDAWYVHAN
jgi:FkbM family methyltransferase